MHLRTIIQLLKAGNYFQTKNGNLEVDPHFPLVDDPAFKDLCVKVERQSNRPKIVCLCGSTRFYDAWLKANFDETMSGNIVLAVGCFPLRREGSSAALNPEQKLALDALHKRKIDLSDEILVINVNGYIGESTRSEIEHAKKTGIPVRYLEQIDGVPAGPGDEEAAA
jgi:hypothetical protein